MTNETIIAKTYDLLKYSIPIIGKLPRAHKFTYGDRIQNMLADLLELTIEAYYAPRDRKRMLLPQINLKLEKMRHFFRLGFDLGLYNSIQYNNFAERIEEIGSNGWRMAQKPSKIKKIDRLRRIKG